MLHRAFNFYPAASEVKNIFQQRKKNFLVDKINKMYNFVNKIIKMETQSQNNFGNEPESLQEKYAGLSMQELANALNNKISKQALGKYELGLMNPSSNVLLSISKALNLKPDYFTKKKQVELGEVLFRKVASLSKKAEESIIERVRDYIERYLEIEHILNIHSIFKNPLKGVKIKTKHDVEEAANKLRKDWNLGTAPISNIVEMLELKGIKVILIDDVDQIDGLAVFTSSGIPVVINAKGKSTERIRFTIIHELAHLTFRFIDEIISNPKRSRKILSFFFKLFTSSN